MFFPKNPSFPVKLFDMGEKTVEVSLISFDRVIFIGYNVGTERTIMVKKWDGSIEKYRRKNTFQI